MWIRLRRRWAGLCVLSAAAMGQVACPVSQAYTQRGLTTTLLSNLSGVLNDTLFFALDATFVNLS